MPRNVKLTKKQALKLQTVLRKLVEFELTLKSDEDFNDVCQAKYWVNNIWRRYFITYEPRKPD